MVIQEKFMSTKMEGLKPVEEEKALFLEVLGDYFHSNPKFYNSDKSPREGRTDKENYEFYEKIEKN